MTKKFDTLLKDKGVKSSERWGPNTVNVYKDCLNVDLKSLETEISYSLQYLEFMSFQLESLILHSVVTKQIYKTFVITSMSIIEALLTDYLKRKKSYNKESWNLLDTYESNSKKVSYVQNENVIETKTVVNLYAKQSPVFKIMTLDSMIKKIGSKSLKIKGINTSVLSRLKDLRNKVHLTTTESTIDTSYKLFDNQVYDSTRRMLWEFLSADEFCNCSISDAKKIYDFLL